MKDEFGDFEEIRDFAPSKKQEEQKNQETNTRIRFPRNNEIIGIVVQRLGGNRMEVKSTDGKTRNCRVPGRFKRKFWLRPGDFVIIIPWPDDNNKGDIVFQYNKNIIYQLKKRGLVGNLAAEF